MTPAGTRQDGNDSVPQFKAWSKLSSSEEKHICSLMNTSQEPWFHSFVLLLSWIHYIYYFEMKISSNVRLYLRRGVTQCTSGTATWKILLDFDRSCTLTYGYFYSINHTSIRLILDTRLSNVQLPPAAVCLCLTSASLPLSTLLIRLPTLTDLHPVVVAALRSEWRQSTGTDGHTNTCSHDPNHVLESKLIIKQDHLCSF